MTPRNDDLPGMQGKPPLVQENPVKAAKVVFGKWRIKVFDLWVDCKVKRPGLHLKHLPRVIFIFLTIPDGSIRVVKDRD